MSLLPLRLKGKKESHLERQRHPCQTMVTKEGEDAFWSLSFPFISCWWLPLAKLNASLKARVIPGFNH